MCDSSKYPRYSIENRNRNPKGFQTPDQNGGGTTDCGYVLRDGLSDDLNWSYEANDPELQKKIQDMMQFGDVQPLEQLVEIRRGLRVTRSFISA
ncbi:MAG: hypothetical protein IPJ94_22895 [Chloroflexi bacterium]|nr:hypothetical protein [Chloroflexota bacterium]